MQGTVHEALNVHIRMILFFDPIQTEVPKLVIFIMTHQILEEKIQVLCIPYDDMQIIKVCPE
jgi:hypothetical protein